MNTWLLLQLSNGHYYGYYQVKEAKEVDVEMKEAVEQPEGGLRTLIFP